MFRLIEKLQCQEGTKNFLKKKKKRKVRRKGFLSRFSLETLAVKKGLVLA